MLFEFRRLQEAEASRLAATPASRAELRVMQARAIRRWAP
jgi:DNA-binding FadR family transcriptional regulator